MGGFGDFSFYLHIYCIVYIICNISLTKSHNYLDLYLTVVEKKILKISNAKKMSRLKRYTKFLSNHHNDKSRKIMRPKFLSIRFLKVKRI